jgi:23S rRNA maturation-related 3'-5' exoribonuclease YhaM
MAKRYLREFPSGSAVEQVFLVRSKALRAARNGSLYIELEVADRSGALPARVWNASQ